MRYYSTQRPVGPGTFPKPEGNRVIGIHNYDGKTHCEEIGHGAWGYIDYEHPLSDKDLDGYELIPEASAWYPITVSSLKHGGGLQVSLGQPINANKRPPDASEDTEETQSKTRYFRTFEEAQRIAKTLGSLDITTERVRGSVTQGEVKAFINGKHILNFGDRIVLPGREDRPEDYYGDDIGGWRSSRPDSEFVLGLIWPPLDHIYHLSDKICEILSIGPDDWIEGKGQVRREEK